MSYVNVLYQWILVRLPRRFSIPMVALLVAYFAFAFPYLVLRAVPRVERYVAEKVPDYAIPRPAFLKIPADYSVVSGIVSATLIIVVALLGILLSYALAAIFYRLVRGRPMKNAIHSRWFISTTNSPLSGAELKKRRNIKPYSTRSGLRRLRKRYRQEQAGRENRGRLEHAGVRWQRQGCD